MGETDYKFGDLTEYSAGRDQQQVSQNRDSLKGSIHSQDPELGSYDRDNVLEIDDVGQATGGRYSLGEDDVLELNGSGDFGEVPNLSISENNDTNEYRIVSKCPNCLEVNTFDLPFSRARYYWHSCNSCAKLIMIDIDLYRKTTEINHEQVTMVPRQGEPGEFSNQQQEAQMGGVFENEKKGYDVTDQESNVDDLHIKCEYCGFSNSSGSMYCKNCGNEPSKSHEYPVLDLNWFRGELARAQVEFKKNDLSSSNLDQARKNYERALQARTAGLDGEGLKELIQLEAEYLKFAELDAEENWVADRLTEMQEDKRFLKRLEALDYEITQALAGFAKAGLEKWKKVGMVKRALITSAAATAVGASLGVVGAAGVGGYFTWRVVKSFLGSGIVAGAGVGIRKLSDSTFESSRHRLDERLDENIEARVNEVEMELLAQVEEYKKGIAKIERKLKIRNVGITSLVIAGSGLSGYYLGKELAAHGVNVSGGGGRMVMQEQGVGDGKGIGVGNQIAEKSSSLLKSAGENIQGWKTRFWGFMHDKFGGGKHAVLEQGPKAAHTPTPLHTPAPEASPTLTSTLKPEAAPSSIPEATPAKPAAGIETEANNASVKITPLEAGGKSTATPDLHESATPKAAEAVEKTGTAKAELPPDVVRRGDGFYNVVHRQLEARLHENPEKFGLVKEQLSDSDMVRKTLHKATLTALKESGVYKAGVQETWINYSPNLKITLDENGHLDLKALPRGSTQIHEFTLKPASASAEITADKHLTGGINTLEQPGLKLGLHNPMLGEVPEPVGATKSGINTLVDPGIKPGLQNPMSSEILGDPKGLTVNEGLGESGGDVQPKGEVSLESGVKIPQTEAELFSKYPGLAEVAREYGLGRELLPVISSQRVGVFLDKVPAGPESVLSGWTRTTVSFVTEDRTMKVLRLTGDLRELSARVSEVLGQLSPEDAAGAEQLSMAEFISKYYNQLKSLEELAKAA